MHWGTIKIYAFDSIATLIASSSDYRLPDRAPKSFIKFPPTSPLLHQAVARMNYLHSPYMKSGKLLNRDLLYTLHIIMNEPIRLIRLFEWRSLTDMEMAAIGTFWKYIGDMMEIDFVAELNKDRWDDGINFLEDVTQWASKYEDEHMRRTRDGQILVGHLLDFFYSSYPVFMRPLIYGLAFVLMGDRWRQIFSLPEPGTATVAFTYTFLLARKLCMRFLALPRSIATDYISEPDIKTGRMHHYHYLKEPWYLPATIWNRWGPLAWLVWATGGMIPGDGGPAMKPEGFLFEDLGPKGKMGKGIEATAHLAEVAQGKLSKGCPFSRSAAS
ncbi:Dephospho-CoA kinase [Hirsutella rhossiliensis]|uniref:Dephospho-CoA kinase n=1 Tax=Hirsutella rhossiliensis TaxID=111463 RepID=A0A9P8SHA5_9HYPO|nr:Dephospho-CoA kinase [Hirsutella rhossiliensis]KAH0962641.1 Dephospho-CoA kinase [Hirsutella rhossiliensis]